MKANKLYPAFAEKLSIAYDVKLIIGSTIYTTYVKQNTINVTTLQLICIFKPRINIYNQNFLQYLCYKNSKSIFCCSIIVTQMRLHDYLYLHCFLEKIIQKHYFIISFHSYSVLTWQMYQYIRIQESGL